MSVTPGPMTLLSQWCFARKNLSVALSSFSDASKALVGLGTQLGVTHEPLLQTVNSELPMLQFEGEFFFVSVNTLKRLRNTSTALVSSNHLPREILATIFTVAVSHIPATSAGASSPPEDPVTFKNVLSGVCSYWRDVALATPALWASIDFRPGGGLDYQELSLERAAKHPLHIRFLALYRGGRNNSDQVVRLLRPHYRRFSSLTFDVGDASTQEVLYDICVSCNDLPPGLQSLTLMADGYFVPNFWHIQAPSEDRLDRFLGPVRSLRMSNTYLGNWTSTAFHGLVDLILDSIKGQALPTGEQLVQILHASPNLVLLKLSRLDITSVPQHTADPIVLERLATLAFRLIPTQFVFWLLKSLVPRPDGLNLLISLDPATGGVANELVIPFLMPHRVKALYLRGPVIGCLYLSKLFASLPRLENLTLDYMFIDNSDSTPHNSNLRLEPLTLKLISSTILEPCTAMIDTLVRHSVSQLTICGCTGAPSAANLRERVPGLVVSEESGGSRWNDRAFED